MERRTCYTPVSMLDDADRHKYDNGDWFNGYVYMSPRGMCYATHYRWTSSVGTKTEVMIEAISNGKKYTWTFPALTITRRGIMGKCARFLNEITQP